MANPITQRDINSTTVNPIANLSIATTLGFLCSRSMQLMNPVHGAIFGAVSSVVSSVVRPIFNQAFAGTDPLARQMGDWLRFGISVGASAFIATAAGYPITATTALVLTASVIAAEIIIKLATEIIVNLGSTLVVTQA